MNSLSTIIPISIIALAGSMSHAQSIKGGWTICTRDLQLRDTLIENANERELTLINAYGIRSVVPMEQVLFIVKSERTSSIEDDELVGAPLPEPSPVRLISLVDGQTIRGSIQESSMPEQLAISLIAGTSIHGDANIPLEQLLQIRDQTSSKITLDDDLIDDLVIMRNADRVTGFIESIGPKILVSVDDSLVELDLDRVEQIFIANDPEPIGGTYLRFSDREILHVIGFDYAPQTPIEISIDPTSLGLHDTGTTDWRFDPGSLEALWVDDASQRVFALSEIEPESIEPMGDRVWVPAPVVMNQDASHEALRSVDFHSPARVRYPMPAGASRFACSIEAPIEIWTDCVVRIIADRNGRERQLFEQRLNADSPDAGINVQLPSGTETLIVEIDPGEHGPIQDRVLMHQPRILGLN